MAEMADSRMVGPLARLARHVGGAIAIALVIAPVACGGASAHLALDERGERRFEHCYRLDEDATVPESEKLGCWRAWTARDGARDAVDTTRVHYARERLRARGPAAIAPSSADR
jgi:hypothetical protein